MQYLVKYVAKTQFIYNKIMIDIIHQSFEMDTIYLNYVHNVGKYTIINLTPVVKNYGLSVESINNRTKEIELNIPTQRNIVIVLNDYNNISYSLLSNSSHTVITVDNEQVLKITLNILSSIKQYSSLILPVDSIIQYYKKLFPVSNITAWSSTVNEVIYHGKIKKITYDNAVNKHRLHFENGMMFLFNQYPFSNSEQIQLQNYDQITPQLFYWFLDKSPESIVFVKKLELINSMVSSTAHDTVENALLDFLDVSQNVSNSLYYNEKFIIKYVIIKFNHLNQKIQLDLTNKNIKLHDVISEITSSHLNIFYFPYDKLYNGTSKQNMSIEIYAYVNNNEYEEFTTEFTTMYNITSNFILRFDCKISEFEALKGFEYD